ncbi:MAG: hypothetical protein JOZ96_21660 [Acidobacteria bacterium]|nr:hypothetical protein [Acidobacteriota bacterium]
MTHTKTLATFLLLLTLFAHAPAQTKREGRPKTKPAAAAEADPLAAQRRAQAVALLTSLADEAAGFRDETLRARAQARAADALWETDVEKARQLFRRAWEAADSADREAQRKMDEDMNAQLKRGGPAMSSTPPNLRKEVLRLAARRERALGEELLAQLTKAKADEAADAKPRPGADTAQRLGLASQLLEEGDTEHALQFAEPALVRANSQTVGFLSTLREKDSATADRLYAALVARVEADPSADANAVSAFMSYLFTPYTFFNVSRGGATGTGTLRGDAATPPQVSAELRANVLRAAARVLLRPQTLEDYERTSSGRTGTYVIIRRLLPFFEQYAPDLTAPLNARAALLAADVPESVRANEAAGDYAFRPRREEAAPERDFVQEALDGAERAQGVDARDGIYASTAVRAAWANDARADELLDKINDSELARRVRGFIDFSFVQTALNRKEAEPALARARKGDLTPFQRAWAFERAAEILGKTDRARAVSLLEEAADEARRIDNNDPDRARALVAVATRYEKLDRPRAWDIISEAARAANSAPDFTGEDGKMILQFRTKHSASMTDFEVEESDLPGVLAALAADNWERAVQLAQSFGGEAARTAAVVAVARAALLKKGK